MATDLHVHFRLPTTYARKLRAVAEANNVSPSLAARHVVLDMLDNGFRQELFEQITTVLDELAAVKAAQRELAEDLKAFRDEFQAALRAVSGG
jgi:hypothetical protein